MAISPQFPQTVTAPKMGALQDLALQAGQVVEAQVIGPAPNGGTQVQINGQMLNLVLPTLAKAGEILKFEVQGTGAQIKLALQLAAPATTAQPLPAVMPALPPTVTTLPLPQVVTSPTVLTNSVALPLAPVTTSLAQPQVLPTTVPASAPVSTTATTLALPTVGTPVPPVALSVPGSTPVVPSAGAAPTVATAAATPLVSAAASTPLPAASTNNAVPVAAVAAAQTPSAQPLPAALPVVASAPMPLPPGVTVPTLAQSAAVALPLVVSPYPQSIKATSEAVAMSPPPSALGTPAQSALAGARPPMPTLAAQTAPQPPATPAQPPVSPQMALSQMVQAALPRQDSVLSLVTALANIVGKVALPESVNRAAQQVLAGRVALDGAKLDGTVLQKTVLTSGIFQEATLARGQLPGAQPDLKTTLLALRQTLASWLGPQAAMAPAAAIAPPVRGQVPRAKASNAAPVDPAAPLPEIGKHLLERTEGALSRMRLHQNASLPDPLAKTADWSMDLPVVVSQQQTVLHIQIHREDEPATGSAVERGWQMRFALTVPQMGEVGAQVSLRGGATGVMLWATERETSDALEGHLVALRQTLAEVGLRPGAVIVRHAEPPTQVSVPSGHVLDERT